jgi:hypothetical protein
MWSESRVDGPAGPLHAHLYRTLTRHTHTNTTHTKHTNTRTHDPNPKQSVRRVKEANADMRCLSVKLPAVHEDGATRDVWW